MIIRLSQQQQNSIVAIDDAKRAEACVRFHPVCMSRACIMRTPDNYIAIRLTEMKSQFRESGFKGIGLKVGKKEHRLAKQKETSQCASA